MKRYRFLNSNLSISDAVDLIQTYMNFSNVHKDCFEHALRRRAKFCTIFSGSNLITFLNGEPNACVLGKLPFQNFKDDVRKKPVVELFVKNKRDAKPLGLILRCRGIWVRRCIAERVSIVALISSR